MTGTLKHDRRKRFFCKLFLRSSPRNAALFGVSCHAVVFCLWPLAVIAAFAGVGRKPIVIGAAALSLLWLYGIIVFGYALYGMLRIQFPHGGKYLHGFIAVAGTILFPVGALTLLAVLIRQRRWGFVGLATAALTGLGILLSGTVIRLVGPDTVSAITWSCVLAFVFSFFGLRDRQKLNWLSLLPLCLVILYSAGLFGYDLKLDAELRQGRIELSKLTGHSIELQAVRQQLEKGLSLDAPPLNALIAANPKDGCEEWAVFMSKEECRRVLEKFRKENPDFVKNLDLFLRLPAGRIAHPDTKNLLVSIRINELNPLRNAARYVSLELAASADDRAKVLQYNAELEKLRDWALSGPFLISKMAGGTIEQYRLKVFPVPLAAGTPTPADWKKILAPQVDWQTQYMNAIGSEAASFESAYWYLRSHEYECGNKIRYARRTLLLTILSVYFKCDYRFALERYKKTAELFRKPGLTAMERCREYQRLCPEGQLKKYVLSRMMLPACSSLYPLPAYVENDRRLAETAVAVEQYRKGHHKLPDSLNFLPEVPRDSFNRLPLLYQHGEIRFYDYDADKKVVHRQGFRLYTHDKNGKDPGGLESRNAFIVLTR